MTLKDLERALVEIMNRNRKVILTTGTEGRKLWDRISKEDFTVKDSDMHKLDKPFNEINMAVFGFEKALELLKQGKLVGRKSSGTFLVQLDAATVDKSKLVDPRLISVVERLFISSILCRPTIRKFNDDGTVTTGYTPTLDDLYAKDWMEIDPDTLDGWW